MTNDSRYDVLFEPVKIGPVTAPNRFYQIPPRTTRRRRAAARLPLLRTRGGSEPRYPP
jgi:dimethylamine/trimethylamine dehydrogenase